MQTRQGAGSAGEPDTEGPDTEGLDDLDAAMAAFSQLQDGPPLLLSLTPLEGWVILSQLQLAQRHPGNVGASQKIAEGFARQLQAHIAPAGPLADLAEKGWLSHYDYVGIPAVPTCRKCGCTDARACPGGCYWIQPDLCSACVQGIDRIRSGVRFVVLGDVAVSVDEALKSGLIRMVGDEAVSTPNDLPLPIWSIGHALADTATSPGTTNRMTDGTDGTDGMTKGNTLPDGGPRA